MTQLILGGIVLPESIKNGYSVSNEPQYVDVEMVTKRLTRELRGWVWVVSYQYGYFDDDMKNRVISICEMGQRTPITCGFLTQTSREELEYSDFFVTSFNRPKFMWSRNIVDDTPVALWGDFSVQLREVYPHDS